MSLDTNRIGQEWEGVENHGEHVVWNVYPEEGVVQGPMDLAFLDKNRYSLVLGEDQIALLTVRGEAAAIYFSGAHMLELGAPTGSLPEDGLLYFLDMGRALQIPWQQHLPVPHDQNVDCTEGCATGVISVRIVDPLTFHESFLRGREGEGEAICRNALSHLLPSFLAIQLERLRNRGVASPRLADAAGSLDTEVLDAQLAPFGLACVEVVVHAEQPAACPV